MTSNLDPGSLAGVTNQPVSWRELLNQKKQSLAFFIAFCYIYFVRLLGLDKIEVFKKQHASYAPALDRWVTIVRTTDWGSPLEVKQTFGKRADFVGKQTVFDVHGNKVRVISKIEYGIKILQITHVLDHAEYDKRKWKE